jgi:hypothetical protein
MQISTHADRADFTAAPPGMAGAKLIKTILDEAYKARLSTQDMLKKIAHEYPCATVNEVLDALKVREEEIAVLRYFLARAEESDKEALLVSINRSLNSP